MRSTIRVTYVKRLEVEQGTPVKVMGIWTECDHISADYIHDARRNISFQLTPDEIPAVKQYAGNMSRPELLVGTVVSSSQFGEQTHFEVLPYEQSLQDYERVSTALARSAVPAYWNFLDKKTKWESTFKNACPENWSQRKKILQPYDVSATMLAMRRYAERQPEFRLEYCTQYIWQSVEKQAMAERYLERLEVLRDLNEHFDLVSRRDLRQWFLMQVDEEVLALFEACVVTLYSSLDIVSHVIDKVYCLGFSDKGAYFRGILLGRSETDDPSKDRRCLQNEYCNDPITQFLMTEWEEWIKQLSEWRNYIVHHGCIQGGFRVELIQDVNSFMPEADDSFLTCLPKRGPLDRLESR